MSTPPAGSLLIMAAMHIEGWALARAGGGAEVAVTGMGRKAADGAARRLDHLSSRRPVAISGFCGGLRPDIRPGEVVVATQIRGPDGVLEIPDASTVAQTLRFAGLRVHVGPIISTDHIVHGKERSRLAGDGALAVDMESYWLLAGRHARADEGENAPDSRSCVVRVVLDASRGGAAWRHPLASGLRAYRSLVHVGVGLRVWAGALAPRTVLIAAPRSFCTGVNRAIETTEEALRHLEAPIYVLHEIVHNRHVVGSFRERGVVFVPEIDHVPEGETVVFSAHGVGQEERRIARDRGLSVIDATCPLVAKVHAKAKHYVDRGFDVVLIGKKGHDEVEGVVGEARDSIHVVEKMADIADLNLDGGRQIAVLSQTTLIPHEVEVLVGALKRQFPGLHVPPGMDICYASQNRQEAVRRLAPHCDLVMVLGSENSSNSKRLVEEVRRMGTSARLVDDEADVDPAWLQGVRTLGLTAGASAPEALVERMIAFVGTLGPVDAREMPSSLEQDGLPLEGGQ